MNQLKIALGAYRDENSIIKLKGRLEHADLNFGCTQGCFTLQDEGYVES